MSLMDYSKAADWIIREKAFDPEQLGKCEAIMCLGNGYMGLRSALSERYLNEHRNLFVAGTFNKFDEHEVTELPNAADVLAKDIRIDGERVSVAAGELLDYGRELNLKTGELSRNVLWRSPKGTELELQFKRIVSFRNLHIIAQSVAITPKDKDVSIKLRTGINGRMSNSGSQHFTEGDKRFYDKTYLQYTQTTTQSDIDFVFTTGAFFYDKDRNPVPMDVVPFMDRRIVDGEYSGTIAAEETLYVEKITDLRTSRDLEHGNDLLGTIWEKGLDSCKEAARRGYQELAAESAKAWAERVWDKIPINIVSNDPMDLLAMRFAQYHLHIMCPSHDNRMNIGAKGLSGEGYKGHIFWDTEIFSLPYFTFSEPESARKLEEYRYLSLPGAHRKAADHRYEGAQFPWESAWLDDGEVTPMWGAADIVTGLPIRVWSGDLEQHITSDVAFGVWQYYEVTKDQDFMDRYGYELIMDTAKFWISRLEFSDNDDRYHVNNVMGPDEYKEHINDNAFTNYMAYWNIRKAIDYYKELKNTKLEIFQKLKERLDLERIYRLWVDKVDKIYLPVPNEDLIMGQDSTYLGLKDVDLTKYKHQEKVGSIFLDYNLDQINQIQVSKQADIMILFLLLEDMFSKEVKLANWNYYEPRTLHDSSLSLSTHVILANDLGNKDLAYELFKRAREIDLGPKMNTSDDGIHAGSMGGIWQSVVFGFGGVRMLDGKLRIEPDLPDHWSELSFYLYWHGQKLFIKITHSGFEVRNETASPERISFECRGITHEVEKEIHIEF